MAQATRKTAKRPQDRAPQVTKPTMAKLLPGIGLLLSFLLLMALCSFDPADSGWSHVTSGPNQPRNWLGPRGAALADVLMSLFGLGAYGVPLAVATLSMQVLLGVRGALMRRLAGWMILLPAWSALLWWLHQGPVIHSGGLIGEAFGHVMVVLLGVIGGLALALIAMVGLLWSTGVGIGNTLNALGAWVLAGMGHIMRLRPHSAEVVVTAQGLHGEAGTVHPVRSQGDYQSAFHAAAGSIPQQPIPGAEDVVQAPDASPEADEEADEHDLRQRVPGQGVFPMGKKTATHHATDVRQPLGAAPSLAPQGDAVAAGKSLAPPGLDNGAADVDGDSIWHQDNCRYGREELREQYARSPAAGLQQGESLSQRQNGPCREPCSFPRRDASFPMPDALTESGACADGWPVQGDTLWRPAQEQASWAEDVEQGMARAKPPHVVLQVPDEAQETHAVSSDAASCSNLHAASAHSGLALRREQQEQRDGCPWEEQPATDHAVHATDLCLGDDLSERAGQGQDGQPRSDAVSSAVDEPWWEPGVHRERGRLGPAEDGDDAQPQARPCGDSQVRDDEDIYKEYINIEGIDGNQTSGQLVPLDHPPVTRKTPGSDRAAGWCGPSVYLLNEQDDSDRRCDPEVLQEMAAQVEQRFCDFGIDVQVKEVLPGPVITSFDLLPARGVKVSQIANLGKDLARALSVNSVRVVEVVPGKSVVGLEIPSEQRMLIGLRELLQTSSFRDAPSPLTLVLGKDIAGEAIVADLARMPHLLVAGTTGSGKSVAINAMILSLLYKSAPDAVRLILIDPKILELSVYEGIPHLLAPVVTDMRDAAKALSWSVGEMERRYRLMYHMGVRNLNGYNQKIQDAMARGQPIPDPFHEEGGTLEPLPAIVVVVDEFADLMMVVGKKIEQLIARLAQKARAAGIHLILATQRPSVDVITGLIKANIPTRIAFQVSSKIDSRTILDQNGAESLLGAGDMLYLPPGTGLPIRVHGAFVSDDEVHRVVADLKERYGPRYVVSAFETPMAGGSAAEGVEDGDGADPFYDEAVALVTRSRRASISGVQRQLRIGYNRAARLVEEMERQGVVGPAESNGNREVLAPPPPEGP